MGVRQSEDTVVDRSWGRASGETATADHDEEDGEERDSCSDPGQNEVVSRELGVDAKSVAVLVELCLDVLEGTRGTAGGDDGCDEGCGLEEEDDDHASEEPAEQLAQNGDDRETDGDDRADVDHLRDVFCCLDVVAERARKRDFGGRDVDAKGVVLVDLVDDEGDRVELVCDGRLCARRGREVDVLPHVVDRLCRALCASAVPVHAEDVCVCKSKLRRRGTRCSGIDFGYVQVAHAELQQEDGALGCLLPDRADVTGEEQRQRH